MRRMRICFTDVFFCFFSVRHNNTRQPFSGTAERIFMKLLPNDREENGVCIAVPKWGLGPPLILGGLKTTHCTLGGDAWRMTQKNYFMLVCWLWHCAAMAVALQMHEGVNAFNLVCFSFRLYVYIFATCATLTTLSFSVHVKPSYRIRIVPLDNIGRTFLIFLAHVFVIRIA